MVLEVPALYMVFLTETEVRVLQSSKQSMRIDLDATCGLQISSSGEQVVIRGPELQSWRRAN